ncbi:TetR/AcrR family transcriptional regulator [Desulfovibrio sp. JC010]|uniref:TetR/AcrR family transcriptional regulator n=1 Tax=Desulfovibrio sp. JC010 TaxID=2593641 RepID=UPI0013D0EA71|nr:TetR/AcrR family transcriptional regulator [Desulfovibrio sp. JC010]NDV26487.1 TetR/AcrR family transcriptional regulator [Desulfovibrio sp. JC010]
MANKKERHEGRHCADDLLDAGLKLLETESVHQLTIDALCRNLKVTKGSFYHHFSSRADYLERMLEHWVEGWTLSSIEAADKGADAIERFNLIVENSHKLPSGTETSIRAWALRDSFAHKYIERVDNMRIEYLRSIFEEVSGDPARAALLCKISYSMFLGVRMMGANISEKEHGDILKLLKQELYGISAE